MFKKIVNDALNFGMGVTAAGKDKAELLAKKLQDKCGVTKAESEKIVKEMISRGEKIRVQFEKDFLSTQAELFDKLEKFAKTNKEKAQKKAAPKAKKPAAKKAKPKSKAKTKTKTETK
ncbi:hypothetical protein IKZ40_04985 [bacterium]|nr:hypothetical protein [bacterium]